MHLPATRIDWFRVLIDLGQYGHTTRAIAGRLDVGVGTVMGWKQGSEPAHYLGDRLIHLWLSATDRPRDQIPTVPIHPRIVVHSGR